MSIFNKNYVINFNELQVHLEGAKFLFLGEIKTPRRIIGDRGYDREPFDEVLAAKELNLSRCIESAMKSWRG